MKKKLLTIGIVALIMSILLGMAFGGIFDWSDFSIFFILSWLLYGLMMMVKNSTNHIGFRLLNLPIGAFLYVMLYVSIELWESYQDKLKPFTSIGDERLQIYATIGVIHAIVMLSVNSILNRLFRS